MLQRTRLLTPGPTPIPSRVRLRMAEEIMHHRKNSFKEIMRGLQPKLQKLFGTEEVVLPLSCSGTGAMTAAVEGLFSKGEKVLVVNAGKFGERFGKIAQNLGLDVHMLTLEWGTAVSANAIKEILDADKNIRGVLMQLSETSTGVLHPVQEVAAITRSRDVLLVVDGISAVGISPCPMQEYGIDALLTGSQKGLMVPPGLSLLALSSRAWEKTSSITQQCFYFNLPKEKENALKGQTLFTPPINLLLALDESLDMLLEFGLDALYRKQWALTMMVRRGLSALGLKLFVEEHFTWGLTSVLLPQGIDATKVVSLAEQNHGIILAGGQDHLKGRIVRVGHMGYVDFADLCGGLYAFAKALKDAGGYSASQNYLEQALSAYSTALTVPHGTNISDVWS